MTRTFKLAAIAVATMFIALLLPGTVKAQEAIECWQEGAFNGPRTCVCTTGYWLWLQPYGQGFCPWDEAGKTGAVPFNGQLEAPAVQPQATPEIQFLYPEKQEQENTQPAPQPYYDPNPMPDERIHRRTQQDAVDEVMGTLLVFGAVILVALWIGYGFYKTITR